MYELIYYWNPTDFDKFTRGGDQLGRYLGVAQYQGQAMWFWEVTHQSESPQANFV